MTWTRVGPDEAAQAWEAQLLRFGDHSPYQSLAWGRYKAARGWAARHFRGEVDGEVVALLQALVREYPLRTVVAWCPGGPVGSLTACAAHSMRQLARLLNVRAWCVRSSFLRAASAEDAAYLESQGWTRPRRPVSTRTTAVWDLTRTEEQLLAGLNRNWRYSLRRAQKANLAIEHLVEPPIEDLTALCAAMNAQKGVVATVRASELASLFGALGEQAIVYGCRNASGRLIAFHSCAVQGSRAWELVAATSDEGRRIGASFAVLWALILHCRRINVAHYDLAGVDPIKAPGVADFKRWTGAQDTEWLGEWEWANSSLLRHAVDFAVRARREAALP